MYEGERGNWVCSLAHWMTHVSITCCICQCPVCCLLCKYWHKVFFLPLDLSVFQQHHFRTIAQCSRIMQHIGQLVGWYTCVLKLFVFQWESHIYIASCYLLAFCIHIYKSESEACILECALPVCSIFLSNMTLLSEGQKSKCNLMRKLSFCLISAECHIVNILYLQAQWCRQVFCMIM